MYKTRGYPIDHELLRARQAQQAVSRRAGRLRRLAGRLRDAISSGA